MLQEMVIERTTNAGVRNRFILEDRIIVHNENSLLIGVFESQQAVLEFFRAFGDEVTIVKDWSNS